MRSTGNNPDWAAAPAWAQWWAVDADGRAHWHMIRPVMRDGAWVYHAGPSHHSGWNKKEFNRAVSVEDWTATLHEYSPTTPARPAMQRVEVRYWWEEDD